MQIRAIILSLALLATGASAAVVATVQAPAPLAQAPARAATLNDLAAKLEERFVDPVAGQKYAAMLRANAETGKYDSLADDAKFAEQVTADLQAVAFDGHLKMFVQPKDLAGGLPPGSAAAKSKTIEAKARLTKDIAYIRLGNFLGSDQALAEIGKFMAENRNAKTLIFDVRTHIGGGLAEMDVIFPHLFERETALVAMDTRSAVDRAGGFPLAGADRLRTIASSDTVVRREHFVVPAKAPQPLAKARVFVLASGRTASAGEHFVLSLRRTHRATVIGETTYGAGNFGGFTPIEGGFSSFIPVGRTFDPDTGKGWDYTGIAPDVPVPAAAAMTEALVRSGLPKAEAEALSAKYGPPSDAVTSKRKAPASVAGI